MKYLYVFILGLLITSFSGCDGRDRLDKSPKDVLQENKLLDSFSEKPIRFVPEKYAEKTTDTIFDNGYVVHLKLYSDMDSHITVETKHEIIKYRDFNLDIEVVKDGENILSTTINKVHPIVKANLDRLNLDTYYLRDFWVAKNNKHHKDIPCIYFEYYSPIVKDSPVIEITPLEKNDFLVTELLN